MKLSQRIFLGALFFFVSTSFAQDRALQQLIQGKKLFWEAKFDQSIQALRQVVGVPNAKKEYLFEAYLYMGFVLTRQNAPLSEVNSAFEQAVKQDPRRELDPLVIPPDLMESFNTVRRQLVGCVYVVTDPEEANLMVVQSDSILFSLEAPAEICDLVNRNYELLVSEEDYEEQLLPLHFTAGKTDTMFVKLKQGFAASGGRSKKKFWGWVFRGGLVAGAAAVLYKTVVEGGEGNLQELPGPPDRPAR